MRCFLIFLLWLIPFLSHTQTVVIPAETARYFLEQDDRAKILAKKDSVNQRMISVVNQELQVKQEIISSYQKDSLVFRAIIANKEQQIFLTKEELSAAQKIISTQRFEVAFSAGAAAGVVIGSVVPAVGTIAGGIIGAAAGCAWYGIHKITQLFKHK